MMGDTETCQYSTKVLPGPSFLAYTGYLQLDLLDVVPEVFSIESSSADLTASSFSLSSNVGLNPLLQSLDHCFVLPEQEKAASGSTGMSYRPKLQASFMHEPYVSCLNEFSL